MRRLLKALLLGLGTLAVLLLVLGLGLGLWLDEARLRDYAAGQLTEGLGRPFTAAGPLELELWPLPRLRATDLRLANPDWAATPYFLQVQALEARLDPGALLERRLVIQELRLEAPLLHLERSAAGQWNWPQAGDPGADRGAAVLELQRLVVGGGRLELHLPVAEGPLLRAELDGSLDQPLALNRLDLHLKVEGEASRLEPLLDADLPPLPYTLEGRLWRNGPAWRLENLQAALGNNALEGELELNLDGPRPRLDGTLQADTLDLRSLPDKAPQSRDGAAPDPALLRSLDAGLTLRAEAILLPGLRLEGLQLRLVLDNGRLEVLPAPSGASPAPP